MALYLLTFNSYTK